MLVTVASIIWKNFSLTSVAEKKSLYNQETETDLNKNADLFKHLSLKTTL